MLQKNNVNDVTHTLQAKGEKCLLKYTFKSVANVNDLLSR